VIDCHRELFDFYADRVRLKEPQRKELRQHRGANQRRLKKNLEKNGDPTPVEHIKQGGYSMRTTTQQLPEKDYDIDDGCVFDVDDLKSDKGADKTALDARKMVHEAAKDPKFNKEPELLKNCVRVHYAEGHHVDVPVYRRHVGDSGAWYELASSDWKKSEPKAVTQWFEDENKKQSPDERDGRQLRRNVCYAKCWRRKNKSWNMPSGLAVSKLVVEKFVGYLERDDESFYWSLKAIHSRLCGNLEVDHPVADEKLTKGPDDALTRNMRDELGKALDKLRVLESWGCTKAQALEAWKEFFGTDFFDKAVEDEKAKEAEKARIAVESLTFQPAPWSAA
jgi:hypothetical protein